MPKVIRAWHQWSWVFHLGWAAVITTVYFTDYKHAIADNTRDITILQQNYDRDNMRTRMAVQEEATSQINKKLDNIEAVNGKIFDRINQLADRSR